MGSTQLNVSRTRAGQFKSLRSGLLKHIFLPQPLPDPSSPMTPVLNAVNDIASSFSRYAAYQQTAFDSGASRSSSSSDANTMERQVERAINQVLGRGIGRSTGSFMNALNSAFPTIATSEGQQVIFTPSRSMVSLYRSGVNGSGTYPTGGNGSGAYPMGGYSNIPIAPIGTDGYAGTISARQANLLRQASVIVGDTLRVLDSLNPFVPEAEADQVDALRALIRSELNSLVDEFGRVDEPRKERVLAYFSALKLHVMGFGRRAFLDDPDRAVTVEDEAQVAGFELLKSYTRDLRQTWNTFFEVDRSPKSFSLSERVERANILLPIVAQVNFDFEAAMDSVSFAENERRSLAARFDTLAGFDVPPQAKAFVSALNFATTDDLSALNFAKAEDLLDATLPDITVYDLTEWIDRFTNIEGPSNLADSGQYGLDFVTDQADQLFWVIAPVIAHLELGESTSPAASPSLEQILSNERVHFALNNLFGQLNALADLSVTGGNENLLTPS